MDNRSPSQRSSNMAAVRGKDTAPELRVRRMLHAMGYRFRLHPQNLPGKPDIVLSRHRLCIFVHGCFWHQHQGCKRATVPKTHIEFWEKKFKQNRDRDESFRAQLEKMGWRVYTIWECETKIIATLMEVLSVCLGRIKDVP
jgi:DNA mismatch endonuclease, patch repair protein